MSETIDSLFARALANGNESQQADFFNEFAYALTIACKNRPDDQTWHVAKRLNESTVRVFTAMLDTYKWTQEKRQADHEQLRCIENEIQAAQERLRTIQREIEAAQS